MTDLNEIQKSQFIIKPVSYHFALAPALKYVRIKHRDSFF